MTPTAPEQSSGFPRRNVTPDSVLRGAALHAALSWMGNVRYIAGRNAASQVSGPTAQQVAAKWAIDNVSAELPATSTHPSENELAWIIWADHYAVLRCGGDVDEARAKLRDDYKRYYELLMALLGQWLASCLQGSTPYDQLLAMMHFLAGECGWGIEEAHNHLTSLHKQGCPSCGIQPGR